MIGIFGGTFDPVHNGHLRVAEVLSEALLFDQLRLLPCGEPAHRAAPQASADDRIAMLQLATEEHSSLVIDEREVRRKGPSYMVDTLALLREELGHEPLVLIIGWDAFIGLPTWQRWQQIIELAHLLVVQRPGSVTAPCDEMQQLLQQHQTDDVTELKQRSAGCILLQPVDVVDVSSTEVRARLAAKEDVSELLPVAVNAYIKEQHLYLS
ncbi:Nicotinate-nucleotide adenylyltransferase [hydrothermal vent metagenome]|uniref:Nicotinate-nucleotide adenylyltransferase n=1 Tax=hydrothermal vent metagenome TaxID=652676 RepID=A0A3B0ZG07_9ZZZZ